MAIVDIAWTILSLRQKTSPQFVRAAGPIGQSPALLAHKSKLMREIQQLIVADGTTSMTNRGLARVEELLRRGFPT
jgi:hypothetical protein